MSLLSAGRGYSTAPVVRVAAPSDPLGRAARAEAVLGEQGQLRGLRLLDAGKGYSDNDAAFIEVPRSTQLWGVSHTYAQFTVCCLVPIKEDL